MTDRADTFIVVCLDQGAYVLDQHDYVLVTPQVFATREDAEDYIATLADHRRPLVIAGRWDRLKMPGGTER